MSRPKGEPPVTLNQWGGSAFLVRWHLKQVARHVGLARTQARLSAESDANVAMLDRLAASVAKARVAFP